MGDAKPERPIARPPLLRQLEDVGKAKNQQVYPYIVVPRHSEAMINRTNVKRFLDENIYHPPQGDVFATKGHIEVVQKIGGQRVVFHVIDDTHDFTPRQWKQTVAVFVDGTPWQFRGWPFASQADLFATISAYLVEYDNNFTPKYTHGAAGEKITAVDPESKIHKDGKIVNA